MAQNIEKPAIAGGPKTRKEFLVFSKPHFGEEEINEMIATIRSGWVGTGPKASQLERDFAAYSGAKHAIAVNSCTAALHLSYVALDLKPGDEIIVPSMTFGATANAVVHAGGMPVFADVDAETLCLDPASVERVITARTRAVVVVHFAGRMGPVRELAKICQRHGIKLIEDCAHAIETSLDGQHAGTFGYAGCFSFYANKNVSTAEGGMFVTNDDRIAERVRKLSLHGMSKDAHKRFSASGYTHYDFDEFGFKYNLPDIAASLGIHQLRRVNENYKLRTRLWNRYLEGLRGLPVGLPSLPNASHNEVHALHLFQIRVPEALRDQFLNAYAAEGIGVGVHYRALTDLHIYRPFVERMAQDVQQFPVSSKFGAQTISLPLGTAMVESDVDDVVYATQKIVRHFVSER